MLKIDVVNSRGAGRWTGKPLLQSEKGGFQAACPVAEWGRKAEK